MSLVARNLQSAVLSDCHISVSAGEVVSLRGASGAGKTLLLRAIADLDPHAGSVWLDGVERAAMSGPEWRRTVRFVAAEAAWWADRVGEHFRAPEEALAMASEVGLPGDCMGWQVARASTGEKQRLGVIRALQDSPRVLLLDEPTAALDATAELAVEALLRRLRDDGAAIILVTHSYSQADRLADRRYLVEAGRVREET